MYLVYLSKLNGCFRGIKWPRSFGNNVELKDDFCLHTFCYIRWILSCKVFEHSMITCGFSVTKTPKYIPISRARIHDKAVGHDRNSALYKNNFMVGFWASGKSPIVYLWLRLLVFVRWVLSKCKSEAENCCWRLGMGLGLCHWCSKVVSTNMWRFWEIAWRFLCYFRFNTWNRLEGCSH